MNWHALRWFAAASVLAGLLLAAGVALRARQRARRENEAWLRVVAALQQIGEEYPEALENPESAGPRKIQLAAFLDQVGRLIPADARDLHGELASIHQGVLGTDYYVRTKCKHLVDLIVERTHLERTPRDKPDLAEGKRVYQRACAACHGEAGRPAAIASTMDPRPADIWHPEYNWTPSEMFNRVTYGGIETAMPSFEEGLTAAERWDVVFYLSAERWPPCAQKLAPLTADDLALSGDFEIANRFGYGAAACLRRDFLPPATR